MNLFTWGIPVTTNSNEFDTWTNWLWNTPASTNDSRENDWVKSITDLANSHLPDLLSTGK